MPKLNEIRQQGIQKQIYVPCSDCGQPRWVRIQKGKPRNSRCLKCQTKLAQKANRDKVIRQDNPINPTIGTLRRGRDVGKSNLHNWFIWCACELCGKERWVMSIKGSPVTHICGNCQLQQRIEKAHALPHLAGDKHPMWKGGKAIRTCRQCGSKFETAQALVRKGYGKYCSRSCCMISELQDGVFERRPTKPEDRLIDILSRHNLPFKYTGDGKYWIGRCNPDFKDTLHKRKVIEVFGVYWHDIFDVSKRTEAFRRYNYDCLIFWEDELKNEKKVVSRIKQFIKAS